MGEIRVSRFSACIRGIPNTCEGRHVVELMRGKGIYTRRRGRGHRFSRDNPKTGWRLRPYDQDLPMQLATSFSLYMENPKKPGEYKWAPIAQCDFVGFTSGGKIRLRLAI